MAMFPIFIIGLVAGAVATSAYFTYKKETPSEVKFKLQEATIIALKEDIKTLEATNEELRAQVQSLKPTPAKRGRKPKHLAE